MRSVHRSIAQARQRARYTDGYKSNTVTVATLPTEMKFSQSREFYSDDPTSIFNVEDFREERALLQTTRRRGCRRATSSETFALLRESAHCRNHENAKRQLPVHWLNVRWCRICMPLSCSESLVGVLDRFSVVWSNGSNVLLSLWEEMGIADDVLAERLDSAYAHLNELMEKMARRVIIQSYESPLHRFSKRRHCAISWPQDAMSCEQVSCSGERCWVCRNLTSRCAYHDTLTSNNIDGSKSIAEGGGSGVASNRKCAARRVQTLEGAGRGVTEESR